MEESDINQLINIYKLIWTFFKKEHYLSEELIKTKQNQKKTLS